MAHVAVRLEGIQKTFGAVPVLRDISWTVPGGRITGLLGLNGSGKTTLLRILMGIVRPTGGQGWVREYDLLTNTPAIRERVGYVAERNNIPGAFSADRLGRLGRAVFPTWDSKQFDAALTRFHIPRDKRVYLMSQGQRMLTSLAFALAHHAEVLLLDEPTNGLDPLVRREFLTNLIEGSYDQGRTVIVSSHRLEEIADIAQDVAILHQGTLAVAGSLEELLERDQIVSLRIRPGMKDLNQLPGATRVWRFQQQASVYVRGFDAREMRESLAQQGVTEWTHHAVSLEELFQDQVNGHVE